MSGYWEVARSPVASFYLSAVAHRAKEDERRYLL
jgi:hypothetical protein